MHLVLTALQQSPSTYIWALLAFLALYLLYTLLKASCDPLRTISGPAWARFTPLWLAKQVVKGDLQHSQIKLHQHYGPVVRLAPPHYSFNDLDAVRKIYAHGSNYAKSDFYYPFGVVGESHGTLFNEQNIKEHSAMRRRVAGLYSLSALLSYELFVDQNNRNLVDRLSEKASTNEALMVTDWMQYFAFDVIGSITVGKPFGLLQNGWDFQGILHNIHKVNIYGSFVGVIGGRWHNTIVALSKLTGMAIPRNASQQYCDDSIEHKRKMIEDGETTEETTGKQDFLEKMFVMKAKGKINEIDLNNTVGNNINAGSDSTAITLSSIIYYLSKHPAMMQKLRDEIQQHKNEGRISEPITFKEAQELPYFQAVIKEALRLHPAVGMSLPRVVPKGGDTIAGHFFPAGTVVGVNAWVIHRNPDAFGPDADEFNPTRWLVSKERSAEMDHYFLTFGGGARTCIGKNVSLLEINKVVPELVTKFDFELEEPDKEWTLMNVFFVVQKFRCFVKERRTDQMYQPITSPYWSDTVKVKR